MEQARLGENPNVIAVQRAALFGFDARRNGKAWGDAGSETRDLEEPIRLAMAGANQRSIEPGEVEPPLASAQVVNADQASERVREKAKWQRLVTRKSVPKPAHLDIEEIDQDVPLIHVTTLAGGFPMTGKIDPDREKPMIGEEPSQIGISIQMVAESVDEKDPADRLSGRFEAIANQRLAVVVIRRDFVAFNLHDETYNPRAGEQSVLRVCLLYVGRRYRDFGGIGK